MVGWLSCWILCTIRISIDAACQLLGVNLPGFMRLFLFSLCPATLVHGVLSLRLGIPGYSSFFAGKRKPRLETTGDTERVSGGFLYGYRLGEHGAYALLG